MARQKLMQETDIISIIREIRVLNRTLEQVPQIKKRMSLAKDIDYIFLNIDNPTATQQDGSRHISFSHINQSQSQNLESV